MIYTKSVIADILIGMLPGTENQLRRKYVAFVLKGESRMLPGDKQHFCIRASNEAKSVLWDLKRQGVVDFEVTLAKKTGRVIKRTWFKVKDNE